MDNFYVITKGTCEVTTKGGQVIARLGAGDFFGETGLLEKRKHRAASVQCTTPVEVMKTVTCRCMPLHAVACRYTTPVEVMRTSGRRRAAAIRGRRVAARRAMAMGRAVWPPRGRLLTATRD